jgi:hypothetical protein
MTCADKSFAKKKRTKFVGFTRPGSVAGRLAGLLAAEF